MILYLRIPIIKNRPMATNINTDKISELIRDCAERYIISRFKALQSEEIMTKSGPGDLVTIADQETEAALDHALTAMYPGSIVIGEESVAAGDKDIAALQNQDGMIWVVDPVDGTANFVHGRDEFAVMLACVIDGENRFGWIYDILGDQMLLAEKGAGVFINGTRLSVAQPKPLTKTTGHARGIFFPKHLRPHVKTFSNDVTKLYSLGCAGHEYIRLASGQSDFAIYSRIRPWDHLMGALAVTEAGGHVAKWDGSAYTPQDDFGGIVAASNQELWEELNQKITRKLVEEHKRTI